MLFEITETPYDIPESGNAEDIMQRYFEAQGYEVLKSFAVVYDPATTKYPESQELVARLFDPAGLAAMRRFTHKLLLGEGVTNVAPGQPDLLVYRPDYSEAFFAEVKTGSDVLKIGQMVGISVLDTFLDCRIEIARVNGPARRYRWAWPGLMPLYTETMVKLPRQHASTFAAK